MRGGYKLINLKGGNILAITLALGVFGAINDSYDKHIILHDFKVGDEKVNDVCVDPVKTEGGYIIYNVYGYDITIGENDEIEVAPTAMAKKSDIETAIGQAEITIDQIDSGGATSGQVPLADGQGGTEWGNLPSGGTKLYRHNISGFTLGTDSLPVIIISATSTPYAHLPSLDVPDVVAFYSKMAGVVITQLVSIGGTSELIDILFTQSDEVYHDQKSVHYGAITDTVTPL